MNRAVTDPIQVLLIEDDPQISEELRLRWEARGWHVLHCESLAAAQRVAALRMHDLLVLDLQLPDGDGLDWLQHWRRQDADTPVLALTARDRVADRILGLQRGADDYLVKPFDPAELDARLEALLRRSSRDRGATVRFGRLLWQRGEARVLLDEQVLDLHPREQEVLVLLLRRAPGLVSKRVIVEALAERNLEVGDSAAEVYVSRLRRKLTGSDVAIETARGFGYRLVLQEPAA